MGKAETDARYLKNRRLLGFCGQNGCREKSRDDFFCPFHREQRSAAERRRRQARKERACLSSQR